MIQGLSVRLNRMEKRGMASLDELKGAVAAQKTVVASVVTLLTEISQKLKDALADDDPAAVAAVVADVQASTQALADAVVAGTPSAPAGGTSGGTPQP